LLAYALPRVESTQAHACHSPTALALFSWQRPRQWPRCCWWWSGAFLFVRSVGAFNYSFSRLSTSGHIWPVSASCIYKQWLVLYVSACFMIETAFNCIFRSYECLHKLSKYFSVFLFLQFFKDFILRKAKGILCTLNRKWDKLK